MMIFFCFVFRFVHFSFLFFFFFSLKNQLPAFLELFFLFLFFPCSSIPLLLKWFVLL